MYWIPLVQVFYEMQKRCSKAIKRSILSELLQFKSRLIHYTSLLLRRISLMVDHYFNFPFTSPLNIPFVDFQLLVTSAQQQRLLTWPSLLIAGSTKTTLAEYTSTTIYIGFGNFVDCFPLFKIHRYIFSEQPRVPLGQFDSLIAHLPIIWNGQSKWCVESVTQFPI